MGQQVANVKLTDEKVKLVIPWSEVLEYLYLSPQSGKCLAVISTFVKL